MRIRNTKVLGQRVDRTYIGRLFPIPLWRRILTVTFLVAAVGWLSLYGIARNQTPYSAGPLTSSHAFIEKDCTVCHAAKGWAGRSVSDAACGKCHDAPAHSALQVSTPSCMSCHVEHRGETQLSRESERSCVGCHSNLNTKSGKTTVAAHVGSFSQHPEFRAVSLGQDNSGFKFSHAKHAGELSQKCSDCHTPEGMAAAGPAKHVRGRALMSIPTYAGTCMPCHALNFDDKIPDAAPHDQPQAVHQFVETALRSYIAAHPEQLGKDGTPGNAAGWLQFKVNADEKELWGTTCQRCHEMKTADAGSLPAVPPAKAPARWFTRASFNHESHQSLNCASCHPKATTSASSAEMLLPGVATCQSCHDDRHQTSAAATCASCHVYHDWSKEKGVEGKYTIDRLRKL